MTYSCIPFSLSGCAFVHAMGMEEERGGDLSGRLDEEGWGRYGGERMEERVWRMKGGWRRGLEYNKI